MTIIKLEELAKAHSGLTSWQCDAPADLVVDLIVEAKRYRHLRAKAMNPGGGLEAFVALGALDYCGDEAKFDAAIDADMDTAGFKHYERASVPHQSHEEQVKALAGWLDQQTKNKEKA